MKECKQTFSLLPFFFLLFECVVQAPQASVHRLSLSYHVEKASYLPEKLS